MSLKNLKFRHVFWAGAALVLVLAFAFAVAPRPVPADFGEAQTAPLSVSVSAEGHAQVRDVFTVSAPIAGRLMRVEKRAGDAVEAGETLAMLLPVDPVLLDARSRSEAQAALQSAEALLGFARAELGRAEAEADYARTELERFETLAQRGTVSQGALDRARLQSRSAQAALQTARASVRAREAERDAAEARLAPPANGQEEGVVRLTSPITGRVLSVEQQSETVLAPGQRVLELGDPVDLQIIAEVRSEDAVRIRENAPARITAWGGEGDLRAEVRRVEPFGARRISALGVEERRVNVILDILEPWEDWSALGHGYRVRAAVEVWRGEDVLTAPVAALFRHEGGWAVFAVENGRARLRRVETGPNDGRTAHIVSGLNPGERVVLYPSDRIHDGARVRAR
ncbi:efflux RND transporter periplasmic adaptor subunit [Alkalicaulis satelles]|uniref:Efflux RND transporter periplasmic adaptor subunit n=1 Tax=Alkalicaulis satelles TaxID=2609175 RepID=A0A5M6ZQH0_9PROT|nr:efflux RND transporter periplasmic adaptor subunit [Alkalicaulis satelles]KAA5804501.1 efflux RND transporter periplasmic adaptor subunit [Alkalicaulis satelles]